MFIYLFLFWIDSTAVTRYQCSLQRIKTSKEFSKYFKMQEVPHTLPSQTIPCSSICWVCLWGCRKSFGNSGTVAELKTNRKMLSDRKFKICIFMAWILLDFSDVISNQKPNTTESQIVVLWKEVQPSEYQFNNTFCSRLLNSSFAEHRLSCVLYFSHLCKHSYSLCI